MWFEGASGNGGAFCFGELTGGTRAGKRCAVRVASAACEAYDGCGALTPGLDVYKRQKVGFQLAFWIGMALGIADTVAPSALAFMNIGGGTYANFLGVNLWGAVICWAAYIIPGLVAQAAEKRAGIKPTWKGLTKEELARLDADARRRELGEGAPDPEDLAPTRA